MSATRSIQNPISEVKLNLKIHFPLKIQNQFLKSFLINSKEKHCVIVGYIQFQFKTSRKYSKLKQNNSCDIYL